MLNGFIQLFEKSYYDLNVENGWSTDTYRQGQDDFLKSLKRYESEERVRSFWIDDKLIGAYVISGEYIPWSCPILQSIHLCQKPHCADDTSHSREELP